MMSKNAGGPAFPETMFDVQTRHGDAIRESRPGMTLRDWFAGQVLAGLMADEGMNHCRWAEYAKCSYDAADAMLAEREKGG